FGTGVALFRAQWYADNQPSSVSEFNYLYANAQGYPIGTNNAATPLSVNLTANCAEVFRNVLQPAGQPTLSTLAPTGASLAALTTVGRAGIDFNAWLSTSDNNLCYYFYTGQYVNTEAATANGDDI